MLPTSVCATIQSFLHRVNQHYIAALSSIDTFQSISASIDQSTMEMLLPSSLIRSSDDDDNDDDADMLVLFFYVTYSLSASLAPCLSSINHVADEVLRRVLSGTSCSPPIKPSIRWKVRNWSEGSPGFFLMVGLIVSRRTPPLYVHYNQCR